MNSENINFPDVDFKIPEETPGDSLREKLISLAEKGKINYSTKYIQKANRDALEKIKIKYDRKLQKSHLKWFQTYSFPNSRTYWKKPT